MRIALLLLLLTLCVSTSPAVADDWPQWLGPRRDSVWREKGIVERFPDEGLKVKWRVPVELGYAGPAVADGRVFVFDYVKTSGEPTNNPGGRDKLEGAERLQCISADTGQVAWTREYDCPYFISYPRGPRCTPTVDGNRVYTLGAEGNLNCFDVESGRTVWSKDFKQDYKAETPVWGHAAHPLVDGDLLYCVVGGEGSVAVAFDKKTGREVWRALSNKAQGYCPPTMIEQGGVKQLLIWHPNSLNSLNPATGEVYWSVPLEPGYEMSITAPRQFGSFLYASGIGNVSALVKLGSGPPAAEVVWRGQPKTSVYCCNSTPLMEQGIIYGSDINTGALMGVQTEDGERLWESTEPTSGGDRRARHATVFLVKHEDRFFLFSETGDLILAKLSPQGYEEISRFHVLDPTNEAFGRDVVWSHPAFANRCVYARNDKEVVCVSLAAGQ